MSADPEEAVHEAFAELRAGLGRLVERAADYASTENVENCVKEVTASLVKIAQYVEKAKAPQSHDHEIRGEIEQLQAELRIQKQLFALCQSALSSR